MSLTLKAHAKLNLALAVGPAQPPKGYHPICSWIAPIDLHDTLTIERLPDGTPSAHEIKWSPDAPRPSRIDWPVEKDLAVRAQRLLEAHTGHSLAARVTLAKRIPVGGGMGGGSSDAAAAMIGLNREFELNLSGDVLRGLSAQLGSDVAFFIDDETPTGPPRPPRPAIVSGFGETIRRVARVPAQVVLICPPFGCPTAAIYQAFDRMLVAGALDLAEADWVDMQVEHAAASDDIAADELFNDLEPPASEFNPDLGDLLGLLDYAVSRHKATVHLTGSGSTMFSIVPRGGSTETLVRVLTESAPGCAVVAAALV